MEIENKSRREFLANLTKSLGACACAVAVGNILTSCESYTALESPSQGITKVMDITSSENITKPIFRTWLQSVGGAGRAVFDDANYSIPIILVRISETEIACFSTLCTHDNCYGDEVAIPSSANPYIKCGCHNSMFDPYKNGKVIQGPAEKPLKQFKSSFNKDTNILTIDF
jgi:Rieske Fe-S protein